MIIENTIYKEKIEEMVKIFCKYSMLQQKKRFKKLTIIAMCLGILVILIGLLSSEIIYIICGSTLIVGYVFLIFISINSQKKLYNKVLKEELNKIGDQVLYRRHIFDKRDLTVQIEYGSKKSELKFSFNNYYKLWIEENNNVIIIQSNKKPNAIFTIIYYNNIDEFKQYCSNNNIEYTIVKK